MLNPDERSLYTAALTPPPGYLFDQALATTFSLDPTTLLTVPLHLALLGAGREETRLDNGIALLGALHRVTDRITVYAQRGRMQAPQTPHVLYGLLEQMVVDVRAPGGGEFHPKLWVCPTFYTWRFSPGCAAHDAPREMKFALALGWGYIGIYPK